MAQRPGAGASGVDPGVAIHLSLSKSVDWNQARNALSISQDGEPVEGRIQITQGGKDVEFVPLSPYRFGAIIALT
jgi:hypothetical protein